MTEEVKKTNRASRKRVAEATPEENSNTQENTQPEAAPVATRKDGRERRKMPSGATALV